MSDILSIGASGVRAYQTALTTVSENIANAGDPAYTRRTAAIRELGVPGSKTVSFNGLGSTVAGVVRASDPFAQASVRSANADLARTQSGTVWLERIESALTGANLGTQMTAFFAAGTSLAAEPTSSALRASMLSAADSVATAFGATARTLDEASTELDGRAQLATDELNRLAQGLLKVNQGLGRTPPGTAAAAQLADQRDQLLEEMSALTDLSVSQDPAGRALVRVGGTTGPLLVDAQEAGEVRFLRSGSVTALSVTRNDGQASFAPTGGALAGLAEGAQRLTAAREQLDAIATDFVEQVNTLQAAGDDLNGTPGAAMFAAGATPSDFTVSLADGSGIAAAARGGGQRDASNLAALATLRTSEGYEAKLGALVTDNAATLKQRNLVSDAQTAILDGAVTAREQISGVNLNSEAIDLVRFQQAYQASSRVIQAARDIFQSILEIR